MNPVTRVNIGATFSPQALRYGARMAGAVLLAFATSALLHLPEEAGR